MPDGGASKFFPPSRHSIQHNASILTPSSNDDHPWLPLRLRSSRLAYHLSIMGSRPVLPRNKLSAWEWTKLILIVVPLPAILLWDMLKSPFSELGRSKSWKRVLLDSATLWLAINLNRRQLRAVFGEAWGTYHAYMKSKKLKPVVEETGDGGRLLWIGPKRTERVILYIHGGAFLFGPLESGPILWGYIQDNLQERGKPTGVAFLNYSLVPDAIFPTQLKQAVLAIQHLIVSGAAPENIQLTGDSAGGLIIHQIFSHILHPVDGVPKLKLSAPLGGAYMMAPWATTVDDEVYHTNDNAGDVVTASVLLYWASKMYEGVPRSAMPYLNAKGAPDDWLKGIDKIVNRILISAGGAEVLRDAVIKYFKTIEKHHKNTTFFLQDKGAHVETFLLLLVRDEDTKFAPFLLDWLEQGFS